MDECVQDLMPGWVEQSPAARVWAPNGRQPRPHPLGANWGVLAKTGETAWAMADETNNLVLRSCAIDEKVGRMADDVHETRTGVGRTARAAVCRRVQLYRSH
jgi:hypothetical protein